MNKNALLLSALMVGCFSTASSAALPPVEDFFRQPEKVGYAISPDGTQFSWMEPWKEGENRLNIMVAPIDGSKEPRRVTNKKDRDIADYSWAGNTHLVYAADSGGDENFHLWLVDLSKSEEPVDVTPYKGVRAMVADTLDEDPEHVLVMMNKENPEVFDVYKLNLFTKELTLEAKNPGNITNWITDHDGVIRFAEVTDGVNIQLLYRPNKDTEFKPVIESTFRDTNSIAGFTADNKKAYLISDVGRDKTALYEYDPENGDKKLIYENPDWGISHIFWSDKRKVLTGCGWLADKFERHYFDKEAEQLAKDMQSKIPDRELAIIDRNKDETKFIIGFWDDRDPGTYYFYDKENPDAFRKLAVIYPWLNHDELSTVKPFTYQSRDGLTIHAYLTIPKGSDGKNLPLVVNPHGGPEARDAWGYNPEAQLLASRGIAVFQPNYRVSTGYGRQFWEAGFKQWGQKQQDDITDGVKYLIDNGIADPKRVAIYGGSYGGYATLMGLIKTPELYCCGIDYVGVSDLFTLFKSIPAYWKPGIEMMKATIGDEATDAEMMKANSPVYHADKIVAPLFIAQGANDPRVVKDQSDKMVEAMKARGVEVEYMVKENEGHGFHNEENKMEFYKAMLDFLGKHLNVTVK